VGNREDLEDVIYNVAPSETPILSMLDSVKVTSTNHEWQTDTLAAANTSNAKIQGDDASTTSVTPTVRLGNYTQIMDKVPRVSGTQGEVDHAGRGDELDYQVVKMGKELKVDMEAIAFGTNQAKLVAAAATAPLMASALSWIGTNDIFGTAGGAASPTTLDGAQTRTDGTQIAYTEPRLKAALQLIWTSGGKPDLIALGGFNKQQMSSFTGRSTPQEDAKSKKIVNSVDVYEGDFGIQKVVAARNMRSRDVLILQTDMWARGTLRGMATKELARTGDSERKQLIVEWTLVSRNEKSSGGVFDNTTS
jgi:hypothetical protein